MDAVFTREPRPGSRPVDGALDAVVSPVDGTCVLVSEVREGTILGLPDPPLDLPSWLGGPVEDGSTVVVLYLSPRDLHHVHAPRAGQVGRVHHRPGDRWPVRPPWSTRSSSPYADNERAVVSLVAGEAQWHVVMIGAFGVGDVRPCVASSSEASPVSVDKGQRLGTFHLGSTVVLIGTRWTPTVTAGEPVRLGARLGTACLAG